MTPQPANIIDEINRLVRTSSQTMRASGRAPSPEELARQLDIPAERVRKLLEIARRPIKLNQ